MVGGKLERFSVACVKDTWTKPKVGRIEGRRRYGWVVGRRVSWGKVEPTVLEQ